jgi:hypothetical protein
MFWNSGLNWISPGHDSVSAPAFLIYWKIFSSSAKSQRLNKYLFPLIQEFRLVSTGLFLVNGA